MNWYKNDLLIDRPCLEKQDIERYINKSLSQKQRFAIENHLLDCELCDAAMEGYINNPSEILVGKSAMSSKRRSIIYLAAAAIMMLLGATAFFNYQSTNLPNMVFASYYEKPSWDIQTRSADKITNYSSAISLYNSGHHEAAISAFEPLLDINTEDNQLRLYKGIAHLESNQISLAEKELTTVRINSDIFFEEATWYLAMLNIKRDQKLEAVSYLDEIIDLENSFFNTKALEIKKRLQN